MGRNELQSSGKRLALPTPAPARNNIQRSVERDALVLSDEPVTPPVARIQQSFIEATLMPGSDMPWFNPAMQKPKPRQEIQKHPALALETPYFLGGAHGTAQIGESSRVPSMHMATNEVPRSLKNQKTLMPRLSVAGSDMKSTNKDEWHDSKISRMSNIFSLSLVNDSGAPNLEVCQRVASSPKLASMSKSRKDEAKAE
jgi:hypothetical protein